MSNLAPFFITGANAKLIVNGMTIGMATDVSYKVDVKHAEPHVLGVYEAMEIQPLMYEVHGSFTVIRYHQKNIDHMLNRGYNIPAGLRHDKNGIGTWTIDKLLAQIGMPFGPFAKEGRAHQAFDPSKMNKAMMFDIEIKVKVGHGQQQAIPIVATKAVVDYTDQGQEFTRNEAQLNPDGSPVVIGTDFYTAPNTECTLAFIRNCRLTSTDFRVSKRGLAIQTYTFAAQYLNEDTFLADMSGVGQQFM